ncbi:DUF1622 domain-containing protein [Synergistaceae bacterium OttesenSCG-928-D05]|nr:DUF1622 domain-containing protein [Synergistaceae bacterium OttesenSCG-928-D05]
MLHDFAYHASQIIEFISVLIIIWGVVMAGSRMVKMGYNCYIRHCNTDRETMIHMRLSFESTLLLGLQFLMAADIIRSISNPDLQGVIILSVIVILRIVLSVALGREVAEMNKLERENQLHDAKMREMQAAGDANKSCEAGA